MKKYAKLINENTIKIAPQNFITANVETIINFNLNEEIMLIYGYKELIEAQKSEEHIYIITYVENETQVIENAEINIEAERKREEERVKNLHMTRGDFFEGFILATGLTENTLRSYIENLSGITETEKILYLNRFDNALDFYRGYPAVSTVGALMGISEEQLTKFFETKDYHELIPNITTV